MPNDDITEVLDRTERALRARNREKDQALVSFWIEFLFRAMLELINLQMHPGGKDG